MVVLRPRKGKVNKMKALGWPTTVENKQVDFDLNTDPKVWRKAKRLGQLDQYEFLAGLVQQWWEGVPTFNPAQLARLVGDMLQVYELNPMLVIGKVYIKSHLNFNLPYDLGQQCLKFHVWVEVGKWIIDLSIRKVLNHDDEYLPHGPFKVTMYPHLKYMEVESYSFKSEADIKLEQLGII
jgi:hypothetical protein